jgi:hypothetical protein
MSLGRDAREQAAYAGLFPDAQPAQAEPGGYVYSWQILLKKGWFEAPKRSSRR